MLGYPKGDGKTLAYPAKDGRRLLSKSGSYTVLGHPVLNLLISLFLPSFHAPYILFLATLFYPCCFPISSYFSPFCEPVFTFLLHCLAPSRFEPFLNFPITVRFLSARVTDFLGPKKVIFGDAISHRTTFTAAVCYKSRIIGVGKLSRVHYVDFKPRSRSQSSGVESFFWLRSIKFQQRLNSESKIQREAKKREQKQIKASENYKNSAFPKPRVIHLSLFQIPIEP